MKITVEYMGYLQVPGFKKNTALEMADDAVVSDVLDKLQIDANKRKYLVPIVNRKREGHTCRLQEGDHLFLYFPVGGG